MNRLFPENSYVGTCSCGSEFIAPKGVLHCHNCLYKRIAELEKTSEGHNLRQQAKGVESVAELLFSQGKLKSTTYDVALAYSSKLLKQADELEQVE